MFLEALAKSGAIVSSVGVALLVSFTIVLLLFPVNKECTAGERCAYTSTGPEWLAEIVQPGFLAASLLIIAAGVFLIRFGRWRGGKKTKGGF